MIVIKEVVAKQPGTSKGPVPWFQVVDESGHVVYAAPTRQEAEAWVKRHG